MAETVAERIARILGERIIAGELAPGTALRQDQVAAEFEASHVPAREAFQRLRAQGLVVAEPRRGVRVAPLDPASVQEVTEIRVALETLALTQAIPRLNAASFDRIERALVAGEQAATMADWELANRDFHHALIAPCKMPRLLAMIDDLQRVNSRIIFAATRSAGWHPGSNHAHRQIFAAVRKRDSGRAITLLTVHIRGLERSSDEGDGKSD